MKVISLFSGAMGLDLGLEAAGHEVVVAVELDPVAVATIKLNRPALPVISKPIEKVTTAEILELAGLEPGGNFMVVGGPCCQAFSTAGKRGSLEDPRGNLFSEFCRVVRQARPKFFLMENVRGLLSAAERHRPLKKRGPGNPKLQSDEVLGSAFAKVVTRLRGLGYYTVFDVLNAADYGTPQRRERFIAIGSRDGNPITMPARTHSVSGEAGTAKWRTLRDALAAAPDPGIPEQIPLSPAQRRYLPMVPPGGDWRDLPAEVQRDAIGGALDSWGGRTGFLRRLSWDRPTPSLVTTPSARATCLGHPSEDRALSIWEYSRVQEFPLGWKFSGHVRDKYRQIGNAVPVGLGRAIGEAIDKAARARSRVIERGVFCFNEDLLKKLSRRPTTVLNPPKSRRYKTPAHVAKWKSGMSVLRDNTQLKINVPIGTRAVTAARHGSTEARRAASRRGVA